MSNGFLIDTTKCMGCRACQVSCKQANDLPAEKTSFFAGEGGYQNPPDFSGKTFCVVSFTEVESDNGKLDWVFAKRQCMHCDEPSCVSACLVGALKKTEEGAVVYDDTKCIGCRYCMLACPFGVPSFEWEKPIPYIRKCTQCTDRTQTDHSCESLNGKALSAESKTRFNASLSMPACAKACPTGAIQYGDKDKMLAIAKDRIAKNPDKYIDYIYGEKEAGGTSYLYLSSVPFEKLGFPATSRIGTRSYPSYTEPAMKSVPIVVLGVGAVLGGLHWLADRKQQVQAAEAGKEG